MVNLKARLQELGGKLFAIRILLNEKIDDCPYKQSTDQNDSPSR